MRLTAMVVILFTAFVAISTGAAAVQQVWYLSDQPRASMPGFLVMTKEQVVSTTGPVTIPDGACVAWAADETTDVTVSFDKQGWSGNVDADEGTAALGPDHLVQFGRHHPLANPPTEFLHDGTVSFVANGPDEEVGTVASNEAPGQFQVPVGQVLVFQLCNQLTQGGETGHDMAVQTDGSSWIMSPAGSPEYPVPELPVLPLTVAGLALVGAVALRRRRG